MAQIDSFELRMTLGNASFEASGPVDAVMTAFEEFKGLLGTKPPAPENVPTQHEPPAGNGSSTPTTTATTELPLAQFVGRDEIKSNAQIATAIVAWAADREDKVSLTASEIRDRWRQKTSIKLPQNLPRDIKSAVRKGWLEKDGDAFSASGYGRREIGLA
jgi:hypothetical protein